MAVKLIMTWDILPGKEQDYFEFIVKDFMPKIQKLGLQPSDAWYTYYGARPQIMAAALMKNLPAMTGVLRSEDWENLTQDLLNYVENFNYKIIKARNGFQL